MRGSTLAGIDGACLVVLTLMWVSVAAAPARASVQSELAFHRGVVAYGDGRMAEARGAFEQVLAEDPEDTSALHYLGLIAQAEGDFDAAIMAA